MAVQLRLGHRYGKKSRGLNQEAVRVRLGFQQLQAPWDQPSLLCRKGDVVRPCAKRQPDLDLLPRQSGLRLPAEAHDERESAQHQIAV